MAKPVRIRVEFDGKKASEDARDFNSGLAKEFAVGTLAADALKKSFELVVEGIGKLVEYTKESIKAAAEDQQAEIALSQALQQRGKFTRSTFEAMKEFAGQMREATTLSNGQVVSIEAQLLKLGVHEKQLKDTTRTVIALSETGLVPLEKAMMSAAQVARGEHAKALEKVGISTASLTALNRDGAIMMKEVEARTDTTTGRYKQMETALGELQGSFGATIISSGNLKKIIEAVRDTVNQFITLLDSSNGKAILNDFFRSIAGWAATAIDAFLGMVRASRDFLTTIEYANKALDGTSGFAVSDVFTKSIDDQRDALIRLSVSQEEVNGYQGKYRDELKRTQSELDAAMNLRQKWDEGVLLRAKGEYTAAAAVRAFVLGQLKDAGVGIDEGALDKRIAQLQEQRKALSMMTGGEFEKSVDERVATIKGNAEAVLGIVGGLSDKLRDISIKGFGVEDPADKKTQKRGRVEKAGEFDTIISAFQKDLIAQESELAKLREDELKKFDDEMRKHNVEADKNFNRSAADYAEYLRGLTIGVQDEAAINSVIAQLEATKKEVKQHAFTDDQMRLDGIKAIQSEENSIILSGIEMRLQEITSMEQLSALKADINRKDELDLQGHNRALEMINKKGQDIQKQDVFTKEKIGRMVAGNIGNFFSDIITSAAKGQESFGTIMAKATSALMMTIGTQLIGLGTTALLAALIPAPWLWGQTGGPAAVGPALAAIGVGVGLVGGGTAIQMATSSPSTSGRKGGTMYDANGDIIRGTSPRSNDVATPNFSRDGAGSGERVINVNVSLNGPVVTAGTHAALGGKLIEMIEESLRQQGTGGQRDVFAAA